MGKKRTKMSIMGYAGDPELWVMVIFFYFINSPCRQQWLSPVYYLYTVVLPVSHDHQNHRWPKLWRGSAVPCDNSAQRRRSAGRSVWSPSRWGVSARWCNRTAPPCLRTPWWSQSYLCSQTLWGGTATHKTLFIQQARLWLQRVQGGTMEMSLSRGQGRPVRTQVRPFHVTRSWASVPARWTMTSPLLLPDTPRQP